MRATHTIIYLALQLEISPIQHTGAEQLKHSRMLILEHDTCIPNILNANHNMSQSHAALAYRSPGAAASCGFLICFNVKAALTHFTATIFGRTRGNIHPKLNTKTRRRHSVSTRLVDQRSFNTFHPSKMTWLGFAARLLSECTKERVQP